MDDAQDLPGPGSRPHAEALAAHRAFVRTLARNLVAPAHVDDVAQEALLAGLSTPPRDQGAVRGWLATAVRNVAGKFHRSERRRAAREAAAAHGEELPSSRELVERLELAQEVVRAVVALREPERTAILWRFYEGVTTAQIAARWNLPADTVRSRLRRGLAQLRAQLDQRYGGRAPWLAAIAPLAGLEPAVLATASGAATAAAGTLALTGAVTMTAKTVLGLVTASAALAVGWWALPERFLARTLAGPPSVATRADPMRSDVAATPTLPSAAELPAVHATRDEAEPEDASAAAEGESGVPLPPPGRVQFVVLDARTGEPLGNVRVRFLHERRFAEYDGGGEVDVVLTSGTWEANVAATGFEPVALEPFEIEVGVTRKLRPIAMARGSAAIEGVVVARGVALDRALTVQLFGDGRAPCDACVEGCPCGWREDVSELALAGDRRFRFAQLGAGVFWLRAFDPEQRIVDARRIELPRGGAAWAELDVSPPTLATFELRHAAGGLFTGDWSSVHREQPASIRFEFRRAGKVVGAAELTPSAEDVRTTMGPPPLPLPDGAVPSQPHGWTLALARDAVVEYEQIHVQYLTKLVNFVNVDRSQWSHASSETERLDRERTELDALLFDFEEPEVGAELAVEAKRSDQFRIAPLPRTELSVIVTCGRYESDETPLDLRFGPPPPVVIAMHATEDAARLGEHLALAQAGACASCHGESSGRAEKELLGLQFGLAQQRIDLDRLKAGLLRIETVPLVFDSGTLESPPSRDE